jgi:hypothetical protein
MATAGETVVKYTFYGDSNLTGEVDSADFARFLAGFDDGATPAWHTGDYDYTGVVDVEDFHLFLAGLRGQGRVSSELFETLTGFVSANGINVDLTTAVPEPATMLSVLALGGFALRRRSSW